MSRLPPRQVAILEVLAGDKEGQERGLYSRRVGVLAGFKPSNRIDAGTTRTLDALALRKLVMFKWDGLNSRQWWITDKGRKALAEFAFGE